MSGDGYGRWVPGGFHGDKIWELAPDQKYIVFRREDIQPTLVTEHEDLAIYDAVVIRTKDALAGPALHSYAASVSLAARLIKDTDAATSQTLQNIADYFHFRALEADSGEHKIPD